MAGLRRVPADLPKAVTGLGPCMSRSVESLSPRRTQGASLIASTEAYRQPAISGWTFASTKNVYRIFASPDKNKRIQRTIGSDHS